MRHTGRVKASGEPKRRHLVWVDVSPHWNGRDRGNQESGNDGELHVSFALESTVVALWW